MDTTKSNLPDDIGLNPIDYLDINGNIKSIYK